MFIEIHGIKKAFGQGDSRVQVLKGIDLSLDQGEFCVLLGPSGSGKSTLLNIIGGIDTADSGDICIDGERLYASPMAGGIWYTELPAMPDYVAESNDVTISIVPNPATTSITITASEALNNAELTIYDLHGRACYNSIMHGTRHEITTYGLPSGIYIVKVTGSHAIVVKKVAIRL